MIFGCFTYLLLSKLWAFHLRWAKSHLNGEGKGWQCSIQWLHWSAGQLHWKTSQTFKSCVSLPLASLMTLEDKEIHITLRSKLKRDPTRGPNIKATIFSFSFMLATLYASAPLQILDFTFTNTFPSSLDYNSSFRFQLAACINSHSFHSSFCTEAWPCCTTLKQLQSQTLISSCSSWQFVHSAFVVSQLRFWFNIWFLLIHSVNLVAVKYSSLSLYRSCHLEHYSTYVSANYLLLKIWEHILSLLAQN